MPFNHLILCCPLLLLPSTFPSIRIFSNELALCIRWPKYQSFSFFISPSNEFSGLISPRIDLFDLLEVQRTLKSVLQCHSQKAYILSLLDIPSNPQPTPLLGCHRAPSAMSSLCYIAGSHQSSFLHMAVPKCQSKFPNSSHPPPGPRVCSLRLRLYSCPTNRFICTILL